MFFSRTPLVFPTSLNRYIIIIIIIVTTHVWANRRTFSKTSPKVCFVFKFFFSRLSLISASVFKTTTRIYIESYRYPRRGMCNIMCTSTLDSHGLNTICLLADARAPAPSCGVFFSPFPPGRPRGRHFVLVYRLLLSSVVNIIKRRVRVKSRTRTSGQTDRRPR